MKVHVFQDKAGEWRWNVRAANGRIIADSGEGYKRRHAAEKAVWRLWLGFHIDSDSFRSRITIDNPRKEEKTNGR